MTTSILKIKGSDFCIVPAGFEFVNQSSVEFYGFRLSKHHLIQCCEHFINQLDTLGYYDRLKAGFNLRTFKYYDLSVYLHGLISLYCSHLEMSCPACFGLVRFSHLPHEVLKSEKPLLNIEYAVLHDMKGLDYCVCVTNIPRLFRTFAAMEKGVDIQLSHKYRLNFLLVNELPF